MGFGTVRSCFVAGRSDCFTVSRKRALQGHFAKCTPAGMFVCGRRTQHVVVHMLVNPEVSL